MFPLWAAYGRPTRGPSGRLQPLAFAEHDYVEDIGMGEDLVGGESREVWRRPGPRAIPARPPKETESPSGTVQTVDGSLPSRTIRTAPSLNSGSKLRRSTDHLFLQGDVSTVRGKAKK